MVMISIGDSCCWPQLLAVLQPACWTPGAWGGTHWRCGSYMDLDLDVEAGGKKEKGSKRDALAGEPAYRSCMWPCGLAGMMWRRCGVRALSGGARAG